MPIERNRQVKIRMSDAEYDRLHTLAKQHQLTAADLVRTTILGKRFARRLPDQNVLKSAVKQLAGVSRNINQVTRSLHEARKSSEISDVYFGGALAQLEEQSAQITSHLQQLRKGLRR